MATLSTCADLLVRALLRHGVDTVFAMPGDQLTPLFLALHAQRHLIKVIHPRHEQGAAYMAYGYARATGRPGVLIVPPGPGLLNALAGISVAYATGTPLLCLTGQIPSQAIGLGRGALHELPDQLATLRTLTKCAERVAHPSQTEQLVDSAFTHMLEGRVRPVALEIPSDILGAPGAGASAVAAGCGVPAEADAGLLARAATLLRGAKRPLIVAGGGAVAAAVALAELAHTLQAPLVSNSGGRGILSERDYLALTWPAGHHLWRDTDVVLAVGTRLAQPRFQWGLDQAMHVIRIDIDPAELADSRAIDLAVLGDAAQTVPALLRHCRGHQAESRREELVALKRAFQSEFAALSPQQEYIDAIRQALPDDAIIVDELTQVGYACRYSLPVYQPGTYITSGYQGALGYGLGTALGAKAACPRRAVLSINGDGGFLYGATELATAVQQKLGVIVIVFNDGQFGNIAREQLAAGYAIATALHNPDLLAFATSFGAHATRVLTPAELRQAIEAARERDLPTVIEVPVGPMPSPWHLIRLPRVRHSQDNRTT